MLALPRLSTSGDANLFHGAHNDAKDEAQRFAHVGTDAYHADGVGCRTEGSLSNRICSYVVARWGEQWRAWQQ